MALVCIAALGLFMFSATITPTKAAVGINKQINFQGKVVNANGTNVTDGNYNFDFRIYTVSSGGAAIWSELSKSTTVTSGVFQTSLGSATALPGSIDFNTDNIYLGVTFNNDVAGEMTPRVRFSAVPQAFNSEKVGGIEASGLVQLSPGAQQTGFINISGNLTAAGTLQGSTATLTGANSLTIGTASSSTGAIIFRNSANTNTVTLQSGSTGASYTLTMPTAAGSTSQCLQTDSVTASQLVFGSCGSGGGSTLQGAYDASSGNTITTTTARDLTVNLADTATDSNFFVNIATGSTSKFAVRKNSVDTFSVDASGYIVSKPTADNAAQFSVQDSGGVDIFVIDSANDRIYVGEPTADATGALLVIDNKNTATDPTGVAGGMYYNSATGDFRCYTATSGWKNCDRPSLREGWYKYEDWITTTITAGTGADLGNIGDLNWTFVSIGTGGTLSKVDVGADASNQGRFGVLQMNSPATVTTGTHLRLDNTGITGVPGDMVVEWDFGPANAAAADGTQTVTRIGLHDSVNATAPVDGIYFQYNTTTSAGNWFRCTRNNSAETCTDTGVARTLTNNVYQRFKMVTNNAGTAVEFFIDEASVGTNSTNLPAAARSYGPAINNSTVTATLRQWKMDYFQLRRTNVTR